MDKRARCGFYRRARDVFFFVARFPFARFVAPTRSGSFALPVSRFHSSNVSGEISPFTSISANLRRCALLLNGIANLVG
jgi:membrane protein DedA with SNARE-associated domain